MTCWTFARDPACCGEQGTFADRVGVSLARSGRDCIRLFRIVLAVLVMLNAAYPRTHQHPSEGFSLDLAKPYGTIAQVTREVVADGVIRGTSQYQTETELGDATSAEAPQYFGPWAGGGIALYKVRAETLAPKHFLNSNDIGTVAVRYLVQPLSQEITRVTIHAVFLEKSHHHRHASDGWVETSEFTAIAERLKALDQQEKQAKELAQEQEHDQKIKELQNTLTEEKSRLQAATVQLQELQQKFRDLHLARAQIVTELADLKAAPFAQARTIQSLSKDQTVTILFHSQHWYLVRVSQDQRGWMSHSSLEILP